MTVSSNLSSLSIAEETSLRVLPGTPTWYSREPNTYAEFGGKISTVARTPIDATRQDKKGTIVDVEAMGGWTEDVTRTNFLKLLQGFFFADARDKPSTQPIFGTSIPITSVTSTYNAASGLGSFWAGALVWAEGFGVASNNGLKTVTASTATTLTVDGLSAEASPPAGAKITTVGDEFASGDISVTVSSGVVTLSSGSSSWPTLLPGEWIMVGGDAAGSFLATCPRMWVRVRTADADDVVADDCVTLGGGAVVADAGAGVSLQVFYGAIIRNEFDRALIKRRSYTLEQMLGEGPTAEQAQYVSGAVPNELKLTLPGQDKITADVTFAALQSYFRSGESGDEILGGTRIAAPGESALNTSSDVKFTKLAVLGDDSTQTPLFAYATQADFAIVNNVSASKALSRIGGIDVNPGNFQVSGNVTAYFETVAALSAVRANADVSYTIGVFAELSQSGFIFDLPLLQLAGEPQVAKDEDVMIPLQVTGAQNKFGYTALFSYFHYVPLAFAETVSA